MDFYGRESELEVLEKLWETVDQKSRMAVITGRRRIGKTLLSQRFIQDKPHLSLFVSKKTEVLLCQEFIKQIKETFDFPVIGEITHFRDLFKLLMEIGKTQPFVLVIDEIQEFLQINPSIFSDIQELWDRYLFQSHVQLILLGSVFSLMKKIFQDSDEPLFGRADRILQLKPFSPSLLQNILQQHGHAATDTLFTFYLITGGTPKYVEQLLTNTVFQEEEIFDFIFSDNSPFLDEGKNVLIEEFGKEYGMYFSILELIALGKTSRSAIESVLQKDIGGHLDRLQSYYGVIEKQRPIHASDQSRNVRYRIEDLFLRFWFRFIFRHHTAVEMGNFSYLKRVLEKNLSTYKGSILEDLFSNLFSQSQQFNKIGSYWEKDGSCEIDLVALNDLDQRIVIGEVKVNKERFRLG
ncbi:MAG: ATP-binding protein, partial [Chlamydiia bacterium]|nr:ATP-binding protein [Chlamydiia bacterium]